MFANLCSRCGKPRIIAKSWKEKVVSHGMVSVVEHTMMICPDKKCQSRVEEEFAIRRRKSAQIEKDKQERNLAHKKKMVNLRLGKSAKKT